MKSKNTGPGFHPYEIIFCPTSDCNLHCSHCFVTRNCKLEIKDAVNFLKSCKNIEKVGFSGGEPFLSVDFVCEICRAAVNKDLLFDNLMTNGVWWKTEEELREKLEKVRDAGFDGKIGLSWDSFHGQKIEKTAVFINAVHEIFKDKSAVAVWSVIPAGKEKEDRKNVEKNMAELKKFLGNDIFVPVYRFMESRLPESYEKPYWKDKKWFKDDFCESTGQVLYVHSNGNIAPCCGFANEFEELLIGTVKDSYETVMKNAENNNMVRICYEKGLGRYRKEFCKGKIKGKTQDMCSFCAWVAKFTYGK